MDFIVNNFDLWTWVIIPILIFLARIVDVSIGTIRVIFISKGFKSIAPVLGFFEVIIWLLAISQIMKNLENWVSYIAYGAGFATGTYVGMLLEEKISIGKVILRVISKKDDCEMIEELKKKYRLTIIDGQSPTGGTKAKIIFMVMKRSEVKDAVAIVNQFHPKAFYTIEDVKYALDDGATPVQKRNVFSFYRKSK